ncbi:MAG: secretin N-terminal domain-containing protein [Sedimentisphaerales bacterium]
MERSKSIISILVGIGAVVIVWRVGIVPQPPAKPVTVAAVEPNKPAETTKPAEANEPMVSFGPRGRRGRGRPGDANEPARLTAAEEPNKPADANNPMEFVNLKSVEMKTIIEKLAQWTGKVIIPTEEAEKLRVTVYAPEKLPRSKAISVIYSALRLKGFIANEDEDQIYIEPITAAKLGRVPTIAADEPLALIENKEQIVRKFFELSSYSPSDMATLLQPLIGEHGYVSVDETTGTVMVIDTVSNLIGLEKIIQQFDVPGAEQTVAEIIEVLHGDPSEIVQMLNILLGETQGMSTMRYNRYRDRGGRGRDSSRRPSPSASSKPTEKKPGSQGGTASSVVVGTTTGPIVLLPEPRRKCIIARASAEDLKRIKEWVAKLDKEEPVESEYEVVQLRYADPREVEQSVGDGFRDLPGTEFLPSILVQPLQQTQQVIVFGRKDLREIVKKMIQEVDVPQGNLVTEHIKLKHADPDTVKEKLDELYEQGSSSSRNSRYGYYGYSSYRGGRGSSSQSSDMVKVISYSTLNEITVIASPENMEQIKKRITEWDVPLDVNSLKPRIIELHNSDPVEMASLLTSLFSENSSSSSRGGRSIYQLLFGGSGADQEKIVGPLYGQLTFEEVPGTKKIIVISKVPEAYGVIDNLVKELDKEEMGEIPEVIELKYADPEDLSERLNALFVEPGQQARIRVTAQGLSGASEMSDTSSSGSSSSASQSSQTDYTTPPWSGAGARSSMGANQQMPISNVIGRVRFVPEPHTKSIMVLSPPEFVDDIQSLISDLDVPGKQVVIEAIIMEIDHSEVTSLGVQLATNPNAFGTLGENALLALGNLTAIGTHGSASGAISPAEGLGASGSGSVLGVGSDIYALIDFLVKKTNAKVLNQQTLWTKDNEEANFFKGSQVAFLGSVTQAVNVGTQQDVTFEKVGMELRARPSITPEDNVDMIVNVQISSLTADLVNSQPVRSLMNTTTNMIVANGQTLLLGGILFQNDTTVQHKLPFFGDLPLIGGAFRHNSINQANNEMLVFMTPRVIEEPNAALPEATGPKKKLDKLRRELGISLQGLSSNDDSQDKDKSDTVAEQPQTQKPSPAAAQAVQADLGISLQGLSSKDDSEDKDESVEVAEQTEAQKPAEAAVQAVQPQPKPEPSEATKARQEPSEATEEASGQATEQSDEAKNPNVQSFDAMRPQITPGQHSTLTWSISNADSVRIEPNIGIVGTLGSTTVTPRRTTTYILIARNENGESRATERIEVVDRTQASDKAVHHASKVADDIKRRGG